MTMQTEAEAVANVAGPELGIPIATMIPIAIQLGKMLFDCLAATEPTATPQSVLTPQIVSGDVADPFTLAFNADYVRGQRRKSRVACRRNGQRHLSKDQLDTVTTRAFQHAFATSDATMMGCAQEAAGMEPIIDDDTDE